MYQVIARKYRPQTFQDVVNQEHVKTTLENAISQNRIAHGYIFSGQRGTGKTTIARWPDSTRRGAAHWRLAP